MKKIFLLVIALLLTAGFSQTAFATADPRLDTAVSNAASYLLRTVPNPQVAAVGGEWSVIALARSEHNVPNAFYERYHRALIQHLRENNGVLDTRRHTEYSRVILALTAVGYDPSDVAGFNLLLPLGDFEQTIWQGINGPIFALIALDSLTYEIPINSTAATKATREMYIAEILRRQTSDGGWNMTAGLGGASISRNERGQADITGMALQALAPYQNNPAVRNATRRALIFLSRSQDPGGGFGSGSAGNSGTVESAVQVLVALNELDISVNDTRFVKNGNNLIDNILSFQNSDGSFSHSRDSTESDLMSTEQALYGLVSAQRALAGRNSLYSMNDRRAR